MGSILRCGELWCIYMMEFIRSGRGLWPGRLLTLLPTPVDHKWGCCRIKYVSVHLACEQSGGCVVCVGQRAFPCSFINNVGMAAHATAFWVLLFKRGCHCFLEVLINVVSLEVPCWYNCFVCDSTLLSHWELEKWIIVSSMFSVRAMAFLSFSFLITYLLWLWKIYL